MDGMMGEKSLLLEKIDSISNSCMTNDDILSDKERILAIEILSEIEGGLYVLDQEITQLDRPTTTRLLTLRITLAPHKRLPPEILAEIFLCVVDGASICFPYRHLPPQWLLCEVCSRWRVVALSEPRLWNRISVYANEIRTPELPRVTSDLARVLSLSRSLSSISLAKCNSFFAGDIHDTLIIPNLPRLKELDLHVPIPIFSCFLRAPATSLLSLESLSLNISTRNVWIPNNLDDYYTRHFTKVSVFQNARNLKELVLLVDGCRVAMAVLNLPIPWNQLTSLVIGQIHPNILAALHGVLRYCCSLEMFHGAYYDKHRTLTNPIPLGNLHLPHLREVKLSGYFSGPDLFVHLRLPWDQLTYLEVETFTRTPMDMTIYDILRNCVRAEALSITHFHDPPVFPGFLQENFPFRLSILTHLELHVFDVLVLDRFTMPALISLRLYNNRPHPFPTIEIGDMILRSECSLSTLVYRGRPHCDDYPSFLKFLALIPTVNELRIGGLVLDPVNLPSCISSEGLTQLKSLSCGLKIASVPQFINLLEIRAKMETAGATRVSISGYLEATKAVAPSLVERWEGRIEQLNAQYKTDFKFYVDRWL